jgi:hypothetical protein
MLLDIIALELRAPPLPRVNKKPDLTALGLQGLRPDNSLTGGLDPLPENGVVRGALVVQGWARIPGEDLEVRILIDGEERVPGAAGRYPRPDVCMVVPAMVDCSKAGFEARFEFEEGDEGTHEIAAVFLSRDGRYRIYPPVRFTWTP